ncbi:hypothetical protein LTR85_008743 [Meristemomyces frigidus]|nr:hypothetical protein LTR85_008743 [Meristemomyces frigidus]
MESEYAAVSSEPSTQKESADVDIRPQQGSAMSEKGSSTASLTEWKPSRQIWLIMSGQVCVVFVISLDSTILTASLPTVAKALDANAVKAFWIVASYLLANAVVQPLMAAFADIFGRRSTFFASLLIFTTGTIVCCTAHNVAQMLAGRTIQGIGGGGILSVNLIILSDLIPLRQRSKYVGLIQLINSLAINLGPVVGGALIKSSWRWVFYINFPFCGIGLAIIPFLLRYARQETTMYDKIGQIDWLGSLMFIAGSTAFLIGVSWGGSEFAWSSAATLVPLIMGIATVIATGVYERFGARTPFLRLSLFRNRSAIAVYVCTVLQSLTLFAQTYFLNLYLLTVKLYSPVLSGAVFLAFAFTVVPVSAIIGALITRFGCYKWAIFCGWLINTFGLGALMILDRETFVPGMIFTFLVAGTGQGILFMAHQVATQASCRTRDVAYATAMFSFMRSLGFCLGIALGGTIFQNFLRHRLSHLGLPLEIAADAEAYASIIRAMTASAQKDTIVEAYAWAFRYLFATMSGISGLGFLLSFIIGEHTLDVEHDATHKLMSKELLQMEQAGHIEP